MKIAKSIFTLSLIAVSACSTAHKNVSLEQDLVPGWKLGYDHLDILSAALEQKDKPREYALHSVEDSMLTANMMIKPTRKTGAKAWIAKAVCQFP